VIGQSIRVLVGLSGGKVKAARAKPLAGILELWRAASVTCAAQSMPIIICAIFGLVGAQLLAALVNAALSLAAYFRSDGILSNYSSTFFVQLMVSAVVGTFSISLARGAISWIALTHARGTPVTLFEALRRSATRLPLLLLSALIYGALVTLGIAGLTVLLRQLRMDITSVDRVVTDFEGMVRVVGVRIVNGLIADPGSPFTELVSYTRYLIRRSSTSYFWLYPYQYTLGEIPLRTWLIGGLSLVPLISAGVLMRLRVPVIIAADQPNRLSTLYEGIRLGAHQAGYLFRHGALLWLITSVLNMVFVVIPLALSQYLLVPTLARETNELWAYPASTLLFTFGSALIGVAFTAFIAAYEAHLYHQVQG
jgi:hypothetical protein